MVVFLFYIGLRLVHYICCSSLQENWGLDLFCKVSFSWDVARYVYKSTIWPYMEYCCHVWADAPSCYLEFVDKLQCWSFTCCLCWTLGSLWKCSIFCYMCITVVDIHLNWLNLFHFLIIEKGLLVILIDCMVFLSPFLDVTRMIWRRSGVILIEKDYLHDENMSWKFLSMICANALLYCILDEVIQNSRSISEWSSFNQQTFVNTFFWNERICLYSNYILFLLEQFYKNKSLDFSNKLRIKPGLLSHRT